MDINEYQQLAARTINKDLTIIEKVHHSLHGLSAEVGELHSIYQKSYQGHELSEEHLKKEAGDSLWMLAEFCTAHGWKMSEIAQMNIDKLRARYPDGFTESNSLHRVAGDI